MRTYLRTVAVTVVTVVLLVTSASAQKNVGGLKSDLESEKAIHALYERFAAAWNKHDPGTLGKMWALDGDHQEPDGSVAKGRDAVTALLKKQHDAVFKTTKLDLKIDAVWLITADVALADGTYEINGIVAPDGKAIPKRAGHLTSILLREDGEWRIAASRLMIPAPLPYKPS